MQRRKEVLSQELSENSAAGRQQKQPADNECQRAARSGAEGSRTLDLCIANAALSQLSYRPSCAAVAAWGIDRLNSRIANLPCQKGVAADLAERQYARENRFTPGAAARHSQDRATRRSIRSIAVDRYA